MADGIEKIYFPEDLELNLNRSHYSMVTVAVGEEEVSFLPSGGALQGHTNAAFEFGVAYEPGIQSWIDKLHTFDRNKRMLTKPIAIAGDDNNEEIDIAVVVYADDVSIDSHILRTMQLTLQQHVASQGNGRGRKFRRRATL